MRIPRSRRLITGPILGLVAATALASAVAVQETKAPPANAAAATIASSSVLPADKVILPSAVKVDLDDDYVRLPLHQGQFNDQTVWYILTEASDQGAADDLGLNYAPKLANAGIGCPACVQDVTLTGAQGNVFGEGVVHFAGIPDFSPARVLKPGPTGFPPSEATPGAVGDAKYSPFIRIAGSATVYNAPIVAVGDGPFDVDHHTNTADRVLAIHPAAKDTGPAQFHGASVDLLLVRGFNSGKPILYISTDASDPGAAVLERSTYLPALDATAFAGGDDFLGSVRERIFPFLNGQTGIDNPQAQGLSHLILDGHASEDASLKNKPLLQALHDFGDALNVQGDFPTLTENNRRAAYSPLWEAQFGEWTPKAVKLGLNTMQTDEFQILKLAAERPDLLTGPGGAAFGSIKALINCPVIGFLDTEPSEDLIKPVPGSAVDFPGAYSQG